MMTKVAFWAVASYLYRLVTDEVIMTRKLTLLK